MSAKNIGGPSRDFDAYYTPLSLAVTMLELFEQVNDGRPETVLEPGAGDGVFPFAAAKVGWRESQWVCVEKRDVIVPILPPATDGEYSQSVDWLAGMDFLDDKTFMSMALRLPPGSNNFDLCVGNPPFSLAEEFVRAAFDCSTQVMFLLRTGFLAGKKRHALYKEFRPKNVWILSQRPSFTGGGTDSADYCIVHWDQRGEKGHDTRLHWIDGDWR